MEFLNKLAAALGLADGATEDSVIQAVTAVRAKADTPVTPVIAKGVISALGVDDKADESTVVASIHALKQGEKGMVSRVEFDALQAKLTTKEADDAVGAAMIAGKITPDQKEWATEYAKADLKGFQTLVAKAPQVIPMDKLGGKTEHADTAVIDEAVLKVAKLMGVDEETIKKYGK